MPTRQHQILDRTPSRWWFGAPILFAATAIGALLLLPGTLRGGPVTAWLLLVALFGGGAVVPLRRWLMWSPENRWRSVRSVVPAALLALAAATVISVAGVAVVLAIEVPGSGLLGRVHLTLLDGNTLVVVVVGALAGTFSLRRPTPLAVVQWSLRHDVSASVGGDAADELRRLPPLLATWVVAAAGVGSAVSRGGPLWPVVGRCSSPPA